MSREISRRAFNYMLTAGAALGMKSWPDGLLGSPALAAGDAKGKVIFPFGTHVYREPHLPLEQFRHDFPILKRLGFTMVKIQEVWSHDERREGEIDLSNVIRVVSDARQNGLRVYFGVTMEDAPGWLWERWPEANQVYETELPNNDPTQYVVPADGKPGPCWHHPGARRAAIRFIEAVGREIGKFDNVEIWNVWQEIGYWPLRPGYPGGVCYCINTLSEFRRWLRTRYKSLSDLNATWKSGYGDWEEVQPPRFHPQVPPIVDFRYFMDDIHLSNVLKWKGDAFRRSDPLHRPILAHVASPTIGGTREWQFAKVLDVLGSSCYPGWTAFEEWDADSPAPGKPISKHIGTSHELWEGVLMKYDYIRSATPHGECWTAELQSGPIIEGLNRHQRIPDRADIRRWVLGSLAGGVRGICFWNHRPEILWQEGYGFGLLDWGSDSSPRADEAGRLSNAINEHVDLFTRGQYPEPEVGLMMNEDLLHFTQADPSIAGKHYVYTIRGIYKSLWSEGFSARFVDASTMPSSPEITKFLILPFPIALSRGVITALQTYVHNGGTLVAEACPGRFTKYGMGAIHEYMATGMLDLFGIRQKRVALIREPENGAKWVGTATTWGDTVEFHNLVGREEFAQLSVFPAYYLQTFVPSTATSILTYKDDCAGCVNTYGKGRAYLIGTLLGHGEIAYNDPQNRRFLAGLLSRAGVNPDRIGKLNRRRREYQGKTAWFLINPTNSAVKETLPTAGHKSVRDLLGEELPRTADGVQVTVEPVGIRCLILES
jgi:beta-galactosidase